MCFSANLFLTVSYLIVELAQTSMRTSPFVGSFGRLKNDPKQIIFERNGQNLYSMEGHSN